MKEMSALISVRICSKISGRARALFAAEKQISPMAESSERKIAMIIDGFNTGGSG